MPRVIIDYSKTIIYKIVCDDDNRLIYVGSTTDFTRRKSQHKHSCNMESNSAYNFKLYKMIRENGGWDNFTMVQVESFPCQNGNESRARENFIMNELKCTMNSNKPFTGLTHAEYDKQYYIDNKIEYNKKKSVKVKCVCGCMISKRNTSTHKKTGKHNALMLAQEPSDVHVAD